MTTTSATRHPSRPVSESDHQSGVNESVKAAVLAAFRHNQSAGLTGDRALFLPTEQRGGRDWALNEILPRRRCSTGKRCFANETAARMRLAEIRGGSSTGRLYGPIGVHFCRKCSSWHLTSKTQKRWKHGRRR